MAFSHIYFADQVGYGLDLRRCLDHLKQGHDDLPMLLSVMATMIDGDGSQAAQFAEMTVRFGFPDNGAAKAAYDELNSLQGKFNTNASVANVQAALAQAFAKLG